MESGCVSVFVCENLEHCHNSMLTHDTQIHKTILHKCPSLRPLSADAASQLQVLRVDGDTLAVDRAEVAVFEQTGEISLGGGLSRHNGMRLEAKVRFEILCHLGLRTLC